MRTCSSRVCKSPAHSIRKEAAVLHSDHSSAGRLQGMRRMRSHFAARVCVQYWELNAPVQRVERWLHLPPVQVQLLAQALDHAPTACTGSYSSQHPPVTGSSKADHA